MGGTMTLLQSLGLPNIVQCEEQQCEMLMKC